MREKILYAILLLPFLGLAQHTITAHFTPEEDFNYVILYRVEPTKNFYVTDSKKDAEGKFNFTLDSLQPPGMYKVVYGIPQEEYNFDVIYNGEENVVLTFSLDKGVNFTSSYENNYLATYEKRMMMLHQKILEAYKKSPVDKEALESLFDEQRNLQMLSEKEMKFFIASKFVRNNRLHFPSKYEDYKTYVKNQKEMFLKGINFSDPVLQRSSFLEDKLYAFVKGFVDSNDLENSYKKNIDQIAITLADVEMDYKKHLLFSLWSNLNKDELFETSRHLADNYLLPVAKKAKDTAMVNSVFKTRNLMIGSKAPNFSWKDEINNSEKNQWLHEVADAEKYVLIFWSSGCSHCLAEVPKIHDVVKSISKEKLKVIAIGLEDEPYQWKNKTLDMPQFIHVLGLGKWENEIGNTYDITGTPTYFVLDAEKRIAAKPETLEELMKIISSNE